MAGSIAHEINNPLTIIRGRSKQALTQLGTSPESDGIRKDLTKIVETVDRIARIIRGLRTFARNAENDPMSQVSVSAIIDNTLALCQERFKKHGIELKIYPVPEATITCREVQISQVLLNLLGNAFDAVTGLPVPWVSVTVKDLSNRVRIEVRDSGRGVSPENIDRIMEPFFTTKPVGAGTGLGLSISKGIVEDHHGSLFLDTSSSSTCFVFELPKSSV